MHEEAKKITIGFLGGRILGYKCLEVLGKEYQNQIKVAFVMAHKKDGEENSDWNPPLLPLAKKFGFPTLEPGSLKDPAILLTIKNAQPDVILNPFCNRIIPAELLAIPKYGVINFHYGKLPQYKGRFIVTHIILNDEKETVATAHYMREEVDAGDIIFEEPVPVLPTDTARDLYMRCTDASLVNFRNVLDHLIWNKALPRQPQEGVGTYFPFEEPNGCQVDLSWPRERIERFIRGVTFSPISRPWVQIAGKKFDIILNNEPKSD